VGHQFIGHTDLIKENKMCIFLYRLPAH